MKKITHFPLKSHRKIEAIGSKFTFSGLLTQTEVGQKIELVS